MNGGCEEERLLAEWRNDQQQALHALHRSLRLSREFVKRHASGEAPDTKHANQAVDPRDALDPPPGMSLYSNAVYTSYADCRPSDRRAVAVETAKAHAGLPEEQGERMTSFDKETGSVKSVVDCSAEADATPRPSGNGMSSEAALAAKEGDALRCSSAQDVVSLAREAVHSMDDLTGFQEARNRDGLLVHYRHVPGTRVHSVRFESDFDCPAEQLLALAREFDTVKQWNKFMTESTILADMSPGELWVYASVWLPFPFSERDVVMHCRGVDLLKEEGCYVVLCDSPTEMSPSAEAQVPKGASSRERVKNCAGSCIRLTPLPSSADGKPRCHATMLVHNDPNMPHVPAFLVNFALNVLSPFVYKKILAVLKDAFSGSGKLATVFQKRLVMRSELYDAIRQRFAEHTAIHDLSKKTGGGLSISNSSSEGEIDAQYGADYQTRFIAS